VTLNRDELKHYQQQMVICCLHRFTDTASAGELSDFACALAMSEGHPKECWSGLQPATVIGLLRTLHKDGLVTRAGERFNPRQGRPEPQWSVPAPRNASFPVPDAPDNDVPVLAMPVLVAVDPLSSLSREQLLAILQVRDDMQQITARFLVEMQELAARAQRALDTRGGAAA
jgi:hypothetical protein